LEYRLFFASGIKFRAEDTRRGWRVDCYSEERTTELGARIAAANAALIELECRLAEGSPR
jgi:hypothetical protein